MQYLTIQSNQVEWNDQNYILGAVEQIDSMSVHVELSDEIYCFIGGDTSINEVVCNNAQDIGNAIQPPSFLQNIWNKLKIF